MSISAQIRIRRDTAANFTSANPTLALGEIAYETDTFRFKVGTGSTAWTALGYAAQNPTSLTVTDSTASTSTTTGALRVTGGVGIGGAVNAGLDAVFNGVRIGRGAAPESTTRVGNSAGSTVASGTAHSTFIGKNAGLYTTGSFNTAVGASALETNTGTELNVAVGFNALKLISGANNVAVGSDAGSSNTSGNNNTLLGHNAGRLGAAQSNVVAVGHFAAIRNQANDTVAVGLQSLQSNTLGTGNVAVGRSALGAATTAAATVTITTAGSGGPAGPTTYSGVQLTYVSGATAVTYPTADITVTSGAVSAVTIVSGGTGFTATSGTVMTAAAASIGNTTGFTCTLATVSTAASNTAVGHNAGLSLTTGTQNTIVGATAGDALTTAGSCVIVGHTAAGALTTSNFVTVVGQSALATASTGATNATVVGYQSLIHATNAADSVALGYRAGRYIADGSNCTSATNTILIGSDARPAADTQTNQIVIGHAGRGDGSNTTVIGNTSTTSTRIPAGSLTVGSASTPTGALTINATSNNPSGSWNGGTDLLTLRTPTEFYGEPAIAFQTANSIGSKIGSKNVNYGAHDILFLTREATSGTTVLTERMRIRHNGRVGIGTDAPSELVHINGGNLRVQSGNVILTSGNGIDFSADANAAGMTSELLDDYEEGTWTPAYQTATPMTTPPTMEVISATYTKIGRQVTVTGFIQTDAVDTTGGSGQLQITGLPFTNSTSRSPMSVSFCEGWVSNPNSGYAQASATHIVIQDRATANGVTADMAAADMTNGVVANQNRLIFSCTYFT